MRLVTFIGVALSIAAITFSGTRGAALGLGAGAVAFARLELPGARLLRTHRGRTIRRAAVACGIIVVSIFVISLTPASRNIVARARSTIAEGMSGSGRTLLWRDSINAVPAFALAGCGTDGFRKVFPAYKSKELARLAPQTNQESSHNSYLDAAISYGLPGAILYVAMIASALSLLTRSRRRSAEKSMKVIITGLTSSVVAVAVHNIFIFDQISTGLYFFALAALAQVASNVSSLDKRRSAEAPAQSRVEPGANRRSPVRVDIRSAKTPASLRGALLMRWPDRMVVIAGLPLLAMSVWYSLGVLRADVEVDRAFAAANAGDLEQVREYGGQATRSPEPTGDYDFQFARALTLCADRMQSAIDRSGIQSEKLVTARDSAIALARAQAKKSLAHTLTPDSSYLLLAYLALMSGDTSGLQAHAAETLRWDPNSANAHWLMAEAHLAEGDSEQAEREAELALDISPASREARSVRDRARTNNEPEHTIEELIARAGELTTQGKTRKAYRTLRHALRRTKGQCPECHYALALVYEKTGSCDDAIIEWETFMRQDPSRASAEQAPAHIERLKKKSLSGGCEDN